MSFTDLEHLPCFTILIDFKKLFYSIEQLFLFKTLQSKFESAKRKYCKIHEID